jgi:hypothetical protein
MSVTALSGLYPAGRPATSGFHPGIAGQRAIPCVDVMDPAVDGQADRGLRHAHGVRRDDCTANIAQTLPKIPFAYKRASVPFPKPNLLPGL